MKTTMLLGAAVAATLGTMSYASGARAEGSPDVCGQPEPVRSKPDNLLESVTMGRRDFVEGTFSARQCQVDALHKALTHSAAHFQDVDVRVGEISRLYHARSGRQQVFLDTSSAGVVLGAAGYGLSGGAGAVTQAYWGYGALTFVLASQFNAFEPTRDLFFGGAIGVDLVQARYETISQAQANLRDVLNKNVALLDHAESECGKLDKAMVNVETWAQNQPDLTAVEPEGRRTAGLCHDLKSTRQAMSAFSGLSEIGDTSLALKEARDVVELDANVMLRDRALRYTPWQTLSAIAAAPFQAASTLLTGQNGKAAIDGLKTQTAFKNLDLKLSDFHLTAAPKGAVAPVIIAASALARLDPSVKRTKVDTPRAKVVAAVTQMESTVGALNDAQSAVAQMNPLVQAITDNAAADHLTFNYDPSTSAITVMVAPPPPPNPPAQQAGPATPGNPAPVTSKP